MEDFLTTTRRVYSIHVKYKGAENSALFLTASLNNKVRLIKV